MNIEHCFWVMDVPCVLEVDVNGEEVFIVNKDIISSYSGRISKLFAKLISGTQILKVIFHDFPGGAEGFELMTRFCYNHGKIEINSLNLCPLYIIAHFMEMNKSVHDTQNLLEQTDKCLEEIGYWSWSELLVALKQCQDLCPFEKSSNLLQKCIDCLVARLALTSETSPCSSIFSPDSSSIRFSFDTKSTESFRGTWWFEDLITLNPNLVEMVVVSMVSQKFDHAIISKFLINYQKSRINRAKLDEKRKIIESVIDLLYLLDGDAISCKSLFGILRVALNPSIKQCCRSKLETMIGLQMDLATLDNLLVPSPIGTNYLYDVNLVLRFLKSFLGKGTCHVPLVKLKKVAMLMDLYIAEVAPDPCLKPSKFLALLRSLPGHARDSYDGIYRAVDIYLQVHSGLSEEDKIKVCCGLNYKKLSSEACDHLANNEKFPPRLGVEALISYHCKLKGLLQDTTQEKSPIDSPCTSLDLNDKNKENNNCDKIVVYSGNLNVSAENEKLRAHLQGMHCRVLELEKVCKKMQNQMTKMMKSRLSSQSSGSRSLPRLCS